MIKMRAPSIVAFAAFFLEEAIPQNTRDTSAGPICMVYGIDFQQGKTYFINAATTSNFTLVSQFENCQSYFLLHLPQC